MRDALEHVVANGSGRTSYIEGYRVGGKTGTAQKVENGRYLDGNYILSFIGFMPANDPKVVVYVAIDNPKGVVQYGGVTVGPIAKNILTDCISALDIERQEGGLTKEYIYTDVKTYKVPDVINLSVSEAKKELKNLKSEVLGDGDTVTYQSPEAGSTLEEGSTVRLFTN